MVPKYFYFDDGVTMHKIASLFVLGCLLTLLGQVNVANGETPGERFEKAMKKKAEYCATHKIDTANGRCDILKLKPADPLATEEGRFAHSIKIPNPVPEDSGYKPGHDATGVLRPSLQDGSGGEFIYKTVENVEGIYMMRPRKEASDYELEHLYALEDPYDATDDPNPHDYFVQPPFGQYQFMELPHTKDEKDSSQPYVRYFRGSEKESKKDYVYMDGTRSHRVPNM